MRRQTRTRITDIGAIVSMLGAGLSLCAFAAVAYVADHGRTLTADEALIVTLTAGAGLAGMIGGILAGMIGHSWR